MIIVGDIIKVLAYPDPEHINHKARVEQVNREDGTYYISNMNMPFLGTFAYKLVLAEEIEEI